jgi:hypothetical protein
MMTEKKKVEKVPIINKLNELLGLEWGDVNWSRMKADDLQTVLNASVSEDTLLKLFDEVPDKANVLIRSVQRRVSAHQFPRARALLENILNQSP